MKRLLSLFALLLTAITLQAQVEPTDTDGNGYRNISTLDHLRWVSENSNSWFWNFELDNDIDAGDTRNWNDGKGWLPIGNNSMYFPGKFDGKGYIIDNLYINRPKESKVGFWGDNYYATIKNIGITNCNITGDQNVGGLVGGNSSSSSVINSYSTGSVKGNYFVGGLIGGNSSSSSVINSYSTANVIGNKYVGGLVGRNSQFSPIINSYSTGSVKGRYYVGGFVGENSFFSNVSNSYSNGSISRSSGTGNSFGGFCGVNSSGIIEHCYSTGEVDCGGAINKGFVGMEKGTTTYTDNYFDSEVSNQQTDAIGSATKKTIVEMKTKSTFTDATWNFDFIWDIAGDYPIIDIDMTFRPIDTDNDGSLNMKSLMDLRWLSESGFDLDKDWELDNDINANDTKNWNSNKGFSPIIIFMNNFDGHGYKIDKLYIDRPNQNHIGLFGETYEATIKNIGITNCDITGNNSIGGLVGVNSSSSFINTYSTGSVSGNNNVGGLVGVNSSFLSNSYSKAIVTGYGYIGGLVGRNFSSVSNSYSTGSVIGNKDVGGLVGNNSSSFINNSYSTGSVIRRSGTKTSFGGFCGVNDRSSIEHCYSIGNVDCGGATNKGFIGSEYGITTYTNNFFDNESSNQKTDTIGSASGKTIVEMKTKSTFTDATWNFDFIWDIAGDYPIIDIDMIFRPTDTDNDGSLNMKSLMDLRWLSESGFDLEKEWELDNDIIASNTKNWNGKNGFIPINRFTGKFDGNNFVIDSLYINRVNQEKIGLFGVTYSARIDNIGVINCEISGNKYIGGLVGFNFSASYISNSYFSGSILGDKYIGGLVGFNSFFSCISNSYSSGHILGDKYIGGLVGLNFSFSCISNSYSTGSVSGNKSVGGFVGLNSSSFVNNSYSSGRVSRRWGDVTSFGGFCGYNNRSRIAHCYTISNVDCGGATNKGFVGFDTLATTYTNNFFDSEFSNQNTDSLDAAKSKTTAQMKTKSTFTDANWDFTNIWNIDPKINMGYPYLEAVPVSILEDLVKENNSLSLYPNPIFRGNILNINLTRPLIDYTIKIYNIDGILIAKYQTQTNILIADNLVIGSYFVVIESGGEIIASEKFIVK